MLACARDVARALLGVGIEKSNTKLSTGDKNNRFVVHEDMPIEIEIENVKIEPSAMEIVPYEAFTPLDGICARYWSCHQKLGRFLGGNPRCDPDGIIITACSIARYVLSNYKINYDEVSIRVAICACYTIAWKNNSDNLFIFPVGHSFLTACYSVMFRNLSTVSVLETQPRRLHHSIEHVEGQILTRVYARMFSYSSCNPICKTLLLADTILSGEPSACLKTDYLIVLRDVTGLFGSLIQISESYDAELSQNFNECTQTPQIGGVVESKTTWEDAFLILCFHAAHHAGVRASIPSAVSARVAAAPPSAVRLSIRMASLYIRCSSRVRTESKGESAAGKMVEIINIHRVLESLTCLLSVHRRSI